MPEVYNSTDSSVQEADNGLRLTSATQWFFFSVILTCNALFFLYWIYKMMKEIENTVREKFEKVYLFLCLCGNRERLEKEKTKQAIEVENEILKEDFDNQLKGIKDLYMKGQIKLNRHNIEKSGVYLHPKRYMNNVINQKRALDEFEQKALRRRKRMQVTDKMNNNLEGFEDENESSNFHDDSADTNMKMVNSRPLKYEESKGAIELQFENTLPLHSKYNFSQQKTINPSDTVGDQGLVTYNNFIQGNDIILPQFHPHEGINDSKSVDEDNSIYMISSKKQKNRAESNKNTAMRKADDYGLYPSKKTDINSSQFAKLPFFKQKQQIGLFGTFDPIEELKKNEGKMSTDDQHLRNQLPDFFKDKNFTNSGSEIEEEEKSLPSRVPPSKLIINNDTLQFITSDEKPIQKLPHRTLQSQKNVLPGTKRSANVSYLEGLLQDERTQIRKMKNRKNTKLADEKSRKINSRYRGKVELEKGVTPSNRAAKMLQLKKSLKQQRLNGLKSELDMEVDSVGQKTEGREKGKRPLQLDKFMDFDEESAEVNMAEDSSEKPQSASGES